MKKFSICLDVGGTYIKGMVFDEYYHPIIDTIRYYDSLSDQSASKIITQLAKSIKDLATFIADSDYFIDFLGIAFPGPFDYETGISYMADLGKFESLYGRNIKSLLYQELIQLNSQFEQTTFYFDNDAVAFAFGENVSSKAERGAYFTLGTGLGSTFILSQTIVKNAYGIPTSGMIYDEKWNGDKLDTLLSATGLEKLSTTVFPSQKSGKELFDLAEQNNSDALRVLHHFGTLIGKSLSRYLVSFEPDEVVFGGQVSKSFPYFASALESESPIRTVFRSSENSSLQTLKGLFYLSQQHD